jgi:chitodextrinase
VKIYDDYGGDTGEIKEFEVTYNGQAFQSTDTPKNIPDNTGVPAVCGAFYMVSDTSPPTGIPSVPADEGIYVSTSTISFSWDIGTSTDPDSGVSGYWLQVSASIGGNEKFDAFVGSTTYTEIFRCEDGKTYYSRIAAVNASGLIGSFSGWSDGVTVYLGPDLTLSDTDISFSDNSPVRGSTITISAVIHNNWNNVRDKVVYYDFTSYAETGSGWPVDSVLWWAQSFKVKNLTEIEKIALYSADTGSLGESVTVDLRYDDGSGFPDETPSGLLEQSSNTGSEGIHWQYFNFSSTLTANTTYWLVAHNSASYLNGWIWSLSNFPDYLNGRSVYSSNQGASWTNYSGQDLMFQIFGKSISVEFYDGDPDGGGTQIGNTKLFATLDSTSTIISSTTWAAAPGGQHDIYVKLGYAGIEKDITNNKAYKTFNVSLEPPSGISNLTALTHSTIEGAIDLKWTAPGEDGTKGTVSDYLIKYSSVSLISKDTFDEAATYYYTWSTYAEGGNEELISITGLFPDTSYWFAIKACDADGQYSVWNSSEDTPGINTMCSAGSLDLAPAAPSNLSAITGNSLILLSWNAPSPFPDDFKLYRLYCDSTTPYDWSNQFIATETINTSFPHTRLQNYNSYYYKVAAVDIEPQMLESNYSNEVSTWSYPLYAPSDFSGIALSSVSIEWIWLDNSDSESGFRIRNVIDEIKTNLSPGTTYWKETGLSINTSYYRYVETYDISGSSAGNKDIRSTLANPPVNMQANNVGFTWINLEWSANSNPPGTRYAVAYSTVSDFSTGVSTPSYSLTSTTTTVNGLENNTTYWFRTWAFNKDDIQTNYSNIITTATTGPVPDAPTDFTGLAISTNSIRWSWVDTSDNEYGFRIYSSTGGFLKTVGVDVSSWTESNLQANTGYSRYVAGYNINGESLPSDTTEYYTSANPPGGLNSVSIYTTSATISWTNAGATRYAVERAPDNGGIPDSWAYIVTWSNNITGTSFTDTGLSAETTYWYRVKSYNGGGIINDTPSNEINIFTLLSPPAGFSGIAKSTDSIEWSWSDTSSYETGFKVKTSTGGIVADLSANTTYWPETSLQPNTQYTRHVSAYDSSRESDASNSDPKYTLANQPEGLSSVAVYTTSATISWTDVGATRYAVERAPDSGGIPGSWAMIKDWNDNITGTGYTDTGLTPETTYWYRIKSYNSDGIISDIPGNTVDILTLPAAPLSFSGVAKSTDSIEWSWSDTSSYETGFKIKTSTEGIVADLSANTTYWPETNLQSNTQYTRYVSAYNSSGESDASNSDSKYTLVNQPSGLNSVSIYVTSATISWTDIGATRYAVERALDSGGVPGTWAMIQDWNDNITGTGYTDTGLTEGTTYWYHVKSYNGNGIINDTASNQIYILTIPDTPTGFAGVTQSTGSINWSWIDNSNKENGYRLKTGTGGIISELPPDTTFWTELNLSINTSYDRHVEAWNLSGYRESNPDIRYTYAKSPLASEIMDVWVTSITIQWQNNSNPAWTRWGVIHSENNFTVSTNTIVDFSSNYTDTSYTNTGLNPSTSYWFKVQAFNGNGIGTVFDLTVSTVTLPDTVPSSNIALVNDGTGEDIDSTQSSSELSANWTESVDNESGISRYLYAIGTTPGETDLVGWTSTSDGTITSVTETELPLVEGVTYYFSVKAENGAGLLSNVTSSDGQCIIFVPVLSVDPINLDFGEIEKGKEKTLSFIITNSGSGILEGTISWNKYWLTVSPTNFNSNNQTVQVTLNNNVPYGQYAGIINITSNGGNTNVTVTMLATCAVPYPNPYRILNEKELTFYGTGVPNSTIKIYTLTGRLVRVLREEKNEFKLTWDGRNEAGEYVVSGLYLYTTSNSIEKNRGRFTVIR